MASAEPQASEPTITSPESIRTRWETEDDLAQHP